MQEVHKKLEYRCTTIKLPLFSGTITVLKITLLHSVSVITNFIIPKRDKTDRQKNITLFRLHAAGARPIPIILGMVIEKDRAIFDSLTFFDPISTFADRGY